MQEKHLEDTLAIYCLKAPLTSNIFVDFMLEQHLFCHMSSSPFRKVYHSLPRNTTLGHPRSSLGHHILLVLTTCFTCLGNRRPTTAQEMLHVATAEAIQRLQERQPGQQTSRTVGAFEEVCGSICFNHPKYRLKN